MRRNDTLPPRALWPRVDLRSSGLRAHGAGGIRPSVSGDGRRALWPSLAWLEKFVHASRIFDEPPGAVPRRGIHASGAGRADGGAVGPSCGAQGDGGPRFDAPVVSGGYAWWYVDALSDDGAYGLTVIAFIGSVFSPYYAWKGRADPLDHCAINVALYSPSGNRWAMTERRRHAVEQSADRLAIGRSSLRWDRGALSIDLNEIGAPIPFPLRGAIRLEPTIVNREAHLLERAGRHFWRPIAPAARVEVVFDKPALRWSGHGYFDCNAGDEPLERAFSSWTWSRAQTEPGAAILYDAERRREPPLSLALRFDGAGPRNTRPPDSCPHTVRPHQSVTG